MYRCQDEISNILVCLCVCQEKIFIVILYIVYCYTNIDCYIVYCYKNIQNNIVGVFVCLSGGNICNIVVCVYVCMTHS